MTIMGEFIPGVMLGIEWLDDDKVLVLDLLIFRMYFVFHRTPNEE